MLNLLLIYYKSGNLNGKTKSKLNKLGFYSQPVEWSQTDQLVVGYSMHQIVLVSDSAMRNDGFSIASITQMAVSGRMENTMSETGKIISCMDTGLNTGQME